MLIFAGVLIFLGCKGGGLANACEQHFDLQNLITNEIQHILEEFEEAVKIIEAGDHRDSVQLSRENLVDYLEDLSEFNIDLPNLLGRYSCEQVDSDEIDFGQIETYIAGDKRLSIREFKVTYGIDEMATRHVQAQKEVGSVLATVGKTLNWDIGSHFFEIEVEYYNIFGRTRNYLIRIEY